MSNPITAKLSYLRIAPRKVRLVADLIRGKGVNEAQAILNFTVKKATDPLLKLLKQAITNAKSSFQTDQSNLYISKITVDEGPKLKRWRPRARGRACEIQKKTSHITLALNITKQAQKRDALKKTSSISKQKKEEKEEKSSKIEKSFKTDDRKTRFSSIKRIKTERGIKKIFKRKAF